MQSLDNKRIAKNTVYLYIRMFVTLIVALYTTRVVLRVLGHSDYGLYNLVAGVLTMFAMFNGALTVGTQRFLNFAMGEHDEEKLQRTFSIAFNIHVIIAVSVFVLSETIGLWFVINKLNIPLGRETATFWVYQFSVIGFVVNLLQLPFQSCIVAHEKMNIYAYMSIYDVVMKLVVAFTISLVATDKLVLYAFLVFVVNLSSILIFNIYCRKNFEECSFKIVKDKALMKAMISYSGWNLLGGTMAPITNTGINILLNIFFNTIVNAARAISLSINTHIVAFVANLQMAANPQIVKLYAEKEFEKFYKLIFNNGRIAIYLFLIIAIPAFIEIEFILKLWLGDYPEYTEVFVRIILIQSYVATLNKPVNMSVHASGNIKWLNIANGFFMLLVLPIAYVALKMGCSPVIVYWINVGFYISDNICNLYFSHKYTNLPVKKFLKEVYLNSIIGAIIMFIPPYYVSTYFDVSWTRFFIVGIVSLLSSFVVIYFWGLTPGMKKIIIDKLTKK